MNFPCRRRKRRVRLNISRCGSLYETVPRTRGVSSAPLYFFSLSLRLASFAFAFSLGNVRIHLAAVPKLSHPLISSPLYKSSAAVSFLPPSPPECAGFFYCYYFLLVLVVRLTSLFVFRLAFNLYLELPRTYFLCTATLYFFYAVRNIDNKCASKFRQYVANNPIYVSANLHQPFSSRTFVFASVVSANF